MNKKILLCAALSGGLAVALGAWGAHGLKALISPESVQSFEVGVRYQMYHSFFLLALGIIPQAFLSDGGRRAVFYLTLLGMLCFSGSVYLLATNSLTNFFDFRQIALVTPFGGLLLIGAWLTLFFSIFLKKK